MKKGGKLEKSDYSENLKELAIALLHSLDSPSTQSPRIKELMLKCQLPWNDDPIQQLQAVLNSLQSQSKKSEKGAPRESESTSGL